MTSRYDICGTGMCRPGGFTITDRALMLCDFKQGDKLADIGCGLGATVDYVRRHYGLNICGVDKDDEVIKEAAVRHKAANCNMDELFISADASCLPFNDNDMDGLIFECSLSKMENTDDVLKQCIRVLKPNGYLIVSDLYSLGENKKLSNLVGNVDTKETLIKKLEINGYSIAYFEDYTDTLHQMWGQMIFEYGLDSMADMLGTDRCGMISIKWGYCLIVAKKEVIN